jgi:anti-sigma regulatory factor (Ser/Thr protein kinase)
VESHAAEATFQHEAFFYAGDEEFLEGTSSFLREAAEAGEPALAVLSAAKVDALRDALVDQSGVIRFADMAEVGSNPARIIPEWREFADEHRGRAIRGIGEPIWADRSPAELVECQRHESLLNLAFADRPGFHLLCPYDTGALSDDVLEEARRSHPRLRLNGDQRESDRCRSLEEVEAPFAQALPEPQADVATMVFQRGTLGALRRLVARKARAANLRVRATDDLVLAVSEIATNSVVHGGGGGLLRIWQEPDAVVCEVSDRGCIDSPLVGRERPASAQANGYGLWLANQVCDLVQVRSYGTGSAVRLHQRTA